MTKFSGVMTLFRKTLGLNISIRSYLVDKHIFTLRSLFYAIPIFLTILMCFASFKIDLINLAKVLYILESYIAVNVEAEHA